MANNRLEDSKILYRSLRFDGSYYLCGYVVELGLKYRICKTLNWDGYFETAKEFKPKDTTGYNSFKTHDLEALLKLSGIEQNIRNNFIAEWSIVRVWNPEKRYQPIGTIKGITAKAMLKSSEIILKELL
jgi:hypothetical protein